MIDILLNENYQPVSDISGDAQRISDYDCVLQDIKMEAVTTEGELFYDKEYGWSLLDFINAENEDLSLIEIKQRIYDKMKKRDYIDISSLSVTVDFEEDIVVIHIRFNFTSGAASDLEIILNKMEIEVTVK